MKRRISFFFALFFAVTGLFVFSSCFQGAQDSDARSGERDGVQFLYVEDEGLLILSSGTVRADNRIFSLPFAAEVKDLLLPLNVESFPAEAFEKLPALERVWCVGTVEFQGNVPENIVLTQSLKRAEEDPFLPSGHILGHCPGEMLEKCLLCDLPLKYEYSEHHTFVLRYNGIPFLRREPCSVRRSWTTVCRFPSLWCPFWDCPLGWDFVSWFGFCTVKRIRRMYSEIPKGDVKKFFRNFFTSPFYLCLQQAERPFYE